MSYNHNLSDYNLLSDTRIDFYGNPDVQFHVNSGRTWESKTTYSYDDEGNKKVGEQVNTTPCPTIDVYNTGEQLEVLVHLPTRNPIISDWFTVTDEYDEFFDAFITGLENGYNGIEEITRFEVTEGNEDLGELIAEVLEEKTPDSVTVPTEPTQTA